MQHNENMKASKRGVKAHSNGVPIRGGLKDSMLLLRKIIDSKGEIRVLSIDFGLDVEQDFVLGIGTGHEFEQLTQGGYTSTRVSELLS
jgi:hypothetical protein